MSKFRQQVLAEIDWAHLECNGETPDHIIVAESIWSEMKEKNKFEKLKRNDATIRRGASPGYVGMRVWHSAALDRRGKKALLLSEEMFKAIFPRVWNHKNESFL